jgi:WXG100 family type VII secretion target
MPIKVMTYVDAWVIASWCPQQNGGDLEMAMAKAESAVMANAAAKFDEVNGALQLMLSTLMSQLSELGGSWKGLGATAFEQVKSQYATDLQSLNNALAETAESIRASGAGYHATDSDAASRVARTGGTFTLPL